jgi:hypothetical protein
MHGAVFPAKDLQSSKRISRQLPVTLSADATAPCIFLFTASAQTTACGLAFRLCHPRLA